MKKSFYISFCILVCACGSQSNSSALNTNQTHLKFYETDTAVTISTSKPNDTQSTKPKPLNLSTPKNTPSHKASHILPKNEYSLNAINPHALSTCLNIKDTKPLHKRHKRWIQQSINEIENGEIVLLADKNTHQMHLYQNGIYQHTYPIEIGMTTAKQGGFKPTPIGLFDLSYKTHTNFYKALLYKMPGYYLIHGKGSGQGEKGSDWTWGCIALSNSQMDDLFNRIGLEQNDKLIPLKERYTLLKNAKLLIVPRGLKNYFCGGISHRNNYKN